MKTMVELEKNGPARADGRDIGMQADGRYIGMQADGRYILVF